MSLLMVNINLHVAHHDVPSTPWYLVPETAKRLNSFERAALIGALYSGGYSEIIRRFAFRPYDQPVYGQSS